jgi:type IV secretory pathway VirB2 component (pilin)
VKIIKKKSLLSLMLLTTFMFLGGVGFVAAQGVQMPSTDLPETTVEEVLENVVNWMLGIITLVAAIVIIIAGIIWATAGGNEDRQANARKMLIAGVVGLIIALAAWGILTVVAGLFD